MSGVIWETAVLEEHRRTRETLGYALHMRPRAIVVSYGGGVNSVALLVWLARNRFVPRAIVMADPGSERAHTIRYRDEVMPAWLASKGFPAIRVVSRAAGGSLLDNHARVDRRETLAEECARTASLPSAAYGLSRCSDKHKGDPMRWWLEAQVWRHGEVLRNGKILRAIGYDMDEPGRARDRFNSDWEHTFCEPWYPLLGAKMDRDACEALILSEGLPLPGKSACTFCPNNSAEEWEQLRRDEPERFSDAVTLSRRASPGITSPDVVGLMRCSKNGQRQLHRWADGDYARGLRDESSDGQLALRPRDAEDMAEAMPCECAL